VSSFPVHLVRHGQTSSYEGDAGLTELGVRQADERGRALAEVVGSGERIGLLHAPTERARRTAECIRRALVESSSAVVDAPRADPGFANVTVWVDGQAYEPTQVRDLHQRLARAGRDQPGWVAEATRFWEADRAPGGAMTFWLTTPLLWHEPPAAVVGRLLTSVRREATGVDRPDRLVIATHAGCLRALVAWAAGEDLGEPDNAEEVRLSVDDDQVVVTFRGDRWRARFPAEPISWFPEGRPSPSRQVN
jgi:broad specificity phosphatase PhoE